MKRICCWMLAFIMVFLVGGSLADTSYQGTVTSGNLLLVQAPFGGKVTDIRVRVGDLVMEGDTLAGISTTPVYAPIEGTVTGLYITEGDKGVVCVASPPGHGVKHTDALVPVVLVDVCIDHCHRQR